MVHTDVDPISNSEDVIDSRDVIARIEQLEEERDGHVLGAPDGSETPNPEGWAQDNPDEAEELAALEKLAVEGEQYASDWQYGEALIRESYFTEYAKQLLEDCGDLPKDLPNYIAIDWDQTAENLKVDYTEIDFDGATYLIR